MNKAIPTDNNIFEEIRLQKLNKLFLISIFFIFNIHYVIKSNCILPILISIYLAFNLIRRQWQILPFSIYIFVLTTGENYFPERIWDHPIAPLFIPLFISALFTLYFLPKSHLIKWFEMGKFTSTVILLELLTIICTIIALIGWAKFFAVDLGSGIAIMQQTIINASKFSILALAIPAFALINASTEEVVFRILFLDTSNFVLKNNFLAVLLQATAFAAVHYKLGFPNGVIGYGMTLLYGSMQGYLRILSKGMFAPYLTHVAADLVIGYSLFFHIINL